MGGGGGGGGSTSVVPSLDLSGSPTMLIRALQEHKVAVSTKRQTHMDFIKNLTPIHILIGPSGEMKSWMVQSRPGFSI